MSKIILLIKKLLPVTAIKNSIYEEMWTQRWAVLGSPCPRKYFTIGGYKIVNRKDLVECASFYRNALWSWAISDQDYSNEL